jgi:Domain of unknown function (DUF222)
VRAGFLGEPDARRDPRGGFDASIDELVVATGLGMGVVLRQVRLCGILAREPASALAALSAGVIGFEQALALAQGAEVLSLAQARAVQGELVPLLAGMSPAGSRAAICRAALRLDPGASRKRHERDHARRSLTVRPGQDGMASLTLTAGAEQVAAVHERITAQARARRRVAGETRTLSQLRAGLLAGAVLGGTDADADKEPRVGVEVVVVVPLDTLAGLGQEPGRIQGLGPINAEHARQLALGPLARLRTLFVDPGGHPPAADARRYPAARWMKRILRLLYPTCVYPGCTVPSKHCDLDHYTPFDQGGWTVLLNLAPLCRRHHTIKGHGAVTLERIGYTLIWTLQNGQTHIVRPHAYFPIRT